MISFPGISSTVKNYNSSENAFLPRIVTVPLVQEKKVRCVPVVQEGEIVSEGQIIAVPEPQDAGAKIHSPIPGTVVGIDTTRCPNGKPEIAIKIKLHGRFSYLGKKNPVTDWKSLSPYAIVQKILDKGVVNTFHVNNTESLANQIDAIGKKKNKTLIVRMYDEDPIRITDSLVTKFNISEIKTGAYITSRAMQADAVLYVFSDDMKKKDELEKFFELGKNEKIMFMNTKKYPSGFQNEICASYKKIFKKNMDFRISKSDLFVDSSTMFEVCQAVENDLPVINKFVHFSGNCLAASCLLNVKIGTLLKDIVFQLGGFSKEPSMIIINGHLTGYSVQSLNVPITKYVKSVVFVSKKKSPDQLMNVCISCGNCRSICSRNLSPDLLYLYKTENKKLDPEYIQTAQYCVECGLCNSVCPARIPLAQIIASMKSPEEYATDEEDEE